MRKILFFVPVLLLLVSACNTQDKILKSKDINFKLTKANEFYDQQKWHSANVIYESLMPVFRGTKNYEELYYRYCYTFYNLEDYLNASYQFKNFVETFPGSDRADECAFMYATCLYKDSPRYPLDQTSTKKAMEALQSYINVHPQSKNLTLANQYMDECREKIERKGAEAANQYYTRGLYLPATVSYKNMVNEYPDSEKSAYYQFMVVQSFYEYARSSAEARQEERYAEAIAEYNFLKEYYPSSDYVKNAEKIFIASQNKVDQLRSQKN